MVPPAPRDVGPDAASLNRLAARAATRRGLRALWWAVSLLGAVALLAVLLVGANRPPDPHVVSFGRVEFRVAPGPAAAAARCAEAADTQHQQEVGLMDRRDLGGFDGMVFRFPKDTSTPFYMRSTPLALSIAFFDAAGRLVSTKDMAPCPDIDGCPLYAADRPYRYALEVKQGDLARLGIMPGATLVLGGGCAPTTA